MEELPIAWISWDNNFCHFILCNGIQFFIILSKRTKTHA